MDEITFVQEVDPAKKSQQISIKPYVDPEKQNMGIEKYDMVVFEGVFHDEQLALIDYNGIKRYITGLNEYAPEIKLIVNPDERAAKIKNIRETVARLEKDLAANIVDPNDPEFWNKVTMLRPDNDKFWGKITIRCGNEPVPLDPEKDPLDLIKIIAIEAGGFSIVAPSLEAARKMNIAPKFYLDRTIDTVALRTEFSKTKNRALSELQKLFDKNPQKLMLIAKVVDANSTQYKKNTPPDVIYENMDKYINGNGVEKVVKRAAQGFLDASRLDMDILRIKAIIKDAAFYKIIHTKGDGFIYHLPTNTMMGRNVSDVIEFLKNPLNDNLWLEISKKVESYWLM